jgi:hypothetical protein
MLHRQFCVAQCEPFASLHPGNFVPSLWRAIKSVTSAANSESSVACAKPGETEFVRLGLLKAVRYHLNVQGLPMKSKSCRGRVQRANRVFLLSPANAAGKRAQLLLREAATFGLAQRLRNGGLALGEAFSFISGLYFRGKLAYASAFAAPPDGAPGVLVITACAGLMSPAALITRTDLCEISAAPVEASEPRYRIPLERDARRLCKQLGDDCEVVLLGSVATPKYVEPLLAIFGERLVFPSEFAGRGDMSRGGLMLRCVREGVELDYVSIATGERHGPRPAKLPKMIVSSRTQNHTKSSAERFSR